SIEIVVDRQSVACRFDACTQRVTSLNDRQRITQHISIRGAALVIVGTSSKTEGSSHRDPRNGRINNRGCPFHADIANIQKFIEHVNAAVTCIAKPQLVEQSWTECMSIR